MNAITHPDRILSALARATDAESPALTWLELNAELPSMSAGDLTVNLDDLERQGLVEKERQAGIRGRPWGWSLTDAGRKRAGATKAKPQPKPAGTVADLVQEIKAEQDAAVAKAPDTGREPRVVPKPAWVREARKLYEDPIAARATRETPLDLTLGSDGMLEIVVPGTDFSMLLTPGQTSQLGEFLTKTAGVWEAHQT